jgi:hypothetical protein
MKLQKYKDYFNKISVFYKPDSSNYWNSITPCCVDKTPKKLGRYYLDFSNKSEYVGQFDERGIPLYRLGNSAMFYHPIVICQYALGLFERIYLAEDDASAYRNKFIQQADWLLENTEFNGTGLGWIINYDISDYNLKAPWMSAMAQGEAISVLTRAHLLTGKEGYLNTAREALSLFEHSVSDGGVLNKFESYSIYEEYPSPRKTVGVLNGFIFSLFGLYDLVIHVEDEKSIKLFNIGINTLSNIIKYYDIGYWSQYYLFDYPKNYPASYTYHVLCAEQLKALYHITEREIFLEYSERWSVQSKKRINKLRTLLTKIIYAHKLSWSDTNK